MQSDPHHVLRLNCGKQPAEIVHALYVAGWALVPVESTDAQRGRYILTANKSVGDRYKAMIEEGRVK